MITVIRRAHRVDLLKRLANTAHSGSSLCAVRSNSASDDSGRWHSVCATIAGRVSNSGNEEGRQHSAEEVPPYLEGEDVRVKVVGVWGVRCWGPSEEGRAVWTPLPQTEERLSFDEHGCLRFGPRAVVAP